MLSRKLPTNEEEWRSYMTRLIKTHLAAAGMSYADLAKELERMGVPTDNKLISSKLRIGGFSAMFLIQALVAMRVEQIELPLRALEHE